VKDKQQPDTLLGRYMISLELNYLLFCGIR